MLFNSRYDQSFADVEADAKATPIGHSAASQKVKRSADLLLSVILVVPVGLLLGVVILAVMIFDRQPVFYLQTRVGRRGQPFRCIKVRTMRLDADARLEQILAEDPAAARQWREHQKLSHDPRVTPIGRFLRKTSLDELPQLLNVFRGEMSLVGPRPIIADEIDRYGADIAYYMAVRPGVTGLWQVSGRSRTSYARRVALDREYVENQSLAKDFSILFRTVRVVLTGEGSA
ncbi:sugar transferase [Maricaulis sp.]|uniref:sugar transferase n=1 Tax=Maricaulis sp. TaxID=1486257 RepID=UPI003A93A815